MEVAALKKIGKGSTLLLMDRNGGQSKAVAKQLKAGGFKRAFVVSNGFNGARLQAATASPSRWRRSARAASRCRCAVRGDTELHLDLPTGAGRAVAVSDIRNCDSCASRLLPSARPSFLEKWTLFKFIVGVKLQVAVSDCGGWCCGNLHIAIQGGVRWVPLCRVDGGEAKGEAQQQREPRGGAARREQHHPRPGGAPCPRDSHEPVVSSRAPPGTACVTMQ